MKTRSQSARREPASARRLAARRLGLILAAAAAHAAVGSGILHVDSIGPQDGDGSSWKRAYPLLQDALAHAGEPGAGISEIRVARGTYRPDLGRDQQQGDPTATFALLSDVALRGGYAGRGADDPDHRDPARLLTVLSGNKWSIWHVVTARDTDETAVLDGFTITEGAARDGCCEHDRGGGLTLWNAAVTIKDCRFFRNLASNVAAAVWMSQSKAFFVECAFE